MRGVPLLMYSLINSSSPPRVSRDNTGPYCRVRCWTTVWQTPQDWLKRRNPSRWASLNDASGAPCAKAPAAHATTNAAAKIPRGISDSSNSPKAFLRARLRQSYSLGQRRREGGGPANIGFSITADSGRIELCCNLLRCRHRYVYCHRRRDQRGM